MSLGSRLKERRKALGLKQSELGELLGVSGAAIGNYENEVSSPKADVLYQIFDVLDCDASFLFQDYIKVKKNVAIPFTSATTRITEKLPRLTEEQLNALEKRVDTYIDDNEVAAKQTMTEPMKKVT